MERRLNLLSTLLYVHGALLLAYAAFAVFGGLVMGGAGLVPELGGDIGLPRSLWFVGAGVYALLAVWNAVLAALCLVGARAHGRRSNRTLAVVGLFAGIGTVFGAFTLPLAVGIGVLGMIAHLDPEAGRAFGGEISAGRSPIR